jgi:hypothetical protein
MSGINNGNSQKVTINYPNELTNSSPREGVEIQNKEKLRELSISIEENLEQYQTKTENLNFCRSMRNCIKYLDSLDKRISKPLHTFSPGYKIECIFYCFARLFNIDTVILYLLCSLIYSFLKLKNGYLGLIPISHVICGTLFTVISKLIIRRPRPILNTRRYFKLKENTHSMPSGDSLQAGIFATMIILYSDNIFRFLAIFLIPAAMLGRIFYNLHYWFDCIIGATLGICISFATYNVINMYID